MTARRCAEKGCSVVYHDLGARFCELHRAKCGERKDKDDDEDEEEEEEEESTEHGTERGAEGKQEEDEDGRVERSTPTKKMDAASLYQRNDGCMRVEVLDMSGGSVRLRVEPTMTILAMKAVIAVQTGTLVSQQSLMLLAHSEHPLPDLSTVAQAGIHDACTVHLVAGEPPAPDLLHSIAGLTSAPDRKIVTSRPMAPAFWPPDPDVLLFCQYGDPHCIVVVDTDTGARLCTYGTKGELEFPSGLAISNDGRYVVVSDSGNGRLQLLQLTLDESRGGEGGRARSCREPDIRVHAG